MSIIVIPKVPITVASIPLLKLNIFKAPFA
jgi:hypothetical protein